MSTSTSEILDARDQYTADIRAALALHPDLYIEGRHLVSPQLRRDACDRLVVVQDEKGDVIRMGKQVGAVVVLCGDWMSMHAWIFFERLQEKQPELYGQVVRLLVESRGML